MADGSIFGGKKAGKKKPRVAFTGEEFGFGYQAVGSLVEEARNGGISDGGKWAVSRLRTEREIGKSASSKVFEFSDTQRQPLRTKEQALMAVKQGTADYAVIPFYSPYAGYDFESLRALSSLFTLLGVEQIDATDQLCLAVHESQVLELAQSAHPQSALSNLVSRRRSTWGSDRSREDNTDYDGDYAGAPSGEMRRGGLVIDQATQMILRDRLDAIHATPDAIQRCKSKLDGLRGAGVEVNTMANSPEPHRDFARLSRQTLSSDRMVNTYFNPTTGDAHYVSAMNGGVQAAGAFYGVVLPFEVADRSSEYIIIEPDMEDAEPTKTRFMVVENNPDHTLYDDAYRTTDAKTRYWSKRLCAVANDSGKDEGVRVMMRFRRDGAAASIGDVENYLRNYGIRHAVVRMDEDSEKDNPAPVVLDMEFSVADFSYNPFRRLRGSVGNGAVKKAFQRWKNRGVTVLAAMPYDEAQLPRHAKRRWWNEAVGAWMADFIETMFIRLSRILFFILPAALLGWYLWVTYFSG